MPALACDKRWIIAPPDARRAPWADRLRISPITAQVLLNRGIDDFESARRFLRPVWEDLHDPDLLPDMDLVAERILRAVRDGEPIVVYGDYDVDGITGASLLWHCLRLVGAKAECYVPHRVDEGYGLHAEALRTLAAAGAKVVVTVDCGISAIEPAHVARELGIDLCITDHHEPGDELPAAYGVVNPKRHDSKYPDPNLCGAGVAFKLAWAIGRKHAGSRKVSNEFREYLLAAIGFAGLATIADIVPLERENRLLASKGLAALPMSNYVGIRALLESARLTEKVDDYDAGFVLGPRLNAAGRMGHAKLAVELFTTASPDRAAEIAKYLEGQNTLRRKEETRILCHAREKIKKQGGLDADRALVLYDEDWHPGVIGIVASRLVEEFHRPVVLLAIRNGRASGSARSVEGFNLFDALSACKQHTLSAGGHAMAGGMKVEPDKLEAFAGAFHAYCREHVTDAHMEPRLRVDAEVLLPTLGENLVREFDMLAPFGPQNRRPVLACIGAKVMGKPRVLKDTHLAFHLNQGGRGYRCIWWRAADRADEIERAARLSAAFTLKINEYQDSRTLELDIVDVKCE